MGIEAAILSEIFSGKKAIPEKRLGSEARINKQGSQSTITIINQQSQQYEQGCEKLRQWIAKR